MVDVDAERAAVVAEALSWAGTPFQHRQQVKSVGVDCLTLLVAVYSTIMDAPAIPPYQPDEHLHRAGERYRDGLLDYFLPLGPVPPLPGDVVTFRFGRRDVAHCGIVVDGRGGFVSAMMEHGHVAFGWISEGYWADRYTGTWRLRRWARQDA